jgi:hypothetical protein
LQPFNHDLDAVQRALGDLARRVVRHQRIEYTVRAQAPETYEELKAAATSRLVILGEFSGLTVYGDPSANHAQRAWHDSLHLRLSAATDMLGELRVALAQANEAAQLTGDTVADWVFADLWGQTLHISKYGSFPIDQVQFTMDFITTGRIGSCGAHDADGGE